MNPTRWIPFFLSNIGFLWTSAAAAAATHRIICCPEKCKTKCHIFGLLSVTSVKCACGWVAPVLFLGMVKSEEIVTILEYFRLVFLLLFLLNGEIAFIFRYFKGKTFQIFGFVTTSALFLLLPVLATEKRRKISNEENGEREEEDLKCLFQNTWRHGRLWLEGERFQWKILPKSWRGLKRREEILNPTCFLCLFRSARGFEEQEGCAGDGAALARGPSCCSAAKTGENTDGFGDNGGWSTKEPKTEPWAVGQLGPSRRQR